MMLVTYLSRMLPLVLLSRMNIPPLILSWLRFIPVAVLAALLAPEIMMDGTNLKLGMDNLSLWAALPCFLAAFVTKNLFVTVFSGMGMMVLLQWFF